MTNTGCHFLPCVRSVDWATFYTPCQSSSIQRYPTYERASLLGRFLGSVCLYFWSGKHGAMVEWYWQVKREVKVKVKCTLVQALRLCTGRTAHRGRRGIALPFLDHGTRRGWWVSVTFWPLKREVLGEKPCSSTTMSTQISLGLTWYWTRASRWEAGDWPTEPWDSGTVR